MQTNSTEFSRWLIAGYTILIGGGLIAIGINNGLFGACRGGGLLHCLMPAMAVYQISQTMAMLLLGWAWRISAKGSLERKTALGGAVLATLLALPLPIIFITMVLK